MRVQYASVEKILGGMRRKRLKQTGWTLAALALLVGAGLWLARDRPAPALFAAEVEGEGTVFPEQRFAKRHRFVNLDAKAMAEVIAKSGRVELNLFPDARFTALLEKPDPLEGGSTFHGSLRGQPGSQVVLNTENGVLGASVQTADGRSFLVTYTGDRRYVVVEIDWMKHNDPHHHADHPFTYKFERTPDGTAVMMPQLPWNITNPVPGFPGFTTTLVGPAWPPQPMTYRPPWGPPVVGLMVLYTPGAEEQVSGGLRGIESRIRLAMGQVNAAFRRSGITARIQLMHTQKINYTSAGDVNTDLRLLTRGATDALFDAHILRGKHRADLVTLLVPTSPRNYSGRGASWMPTSLRPAPAYGFNVVEAPYMNTTALAHELGHNLGCSHATNDLGGNINGAFTNAHGYRFSLTTNTRTFNYQTIMAYGPGIPLGYYSNPNVLFYGLPVGSAAANNAAAINQTARMVGSYLSGGYNPPVYLPWTPPANRPGLRATTPWGN